jgi:hypothetical protein
MLKETNLKTRRLSKKLNNKLYRLFQVEKVIILTGNLSNLPKIIDRSIIYSILIFRTLLDIYIVRSCRPYLNLIGV